MQDAGNKESNLLPLLQRLAPSFRTVNFAPRGAGVREQALSPQGEFRAGLLLYVPAAGVSCAEWPKSTGHSLAGGCGRSDRSGLGRNCFLALGICHVQHIAHQWKVVRHKAIGSGHRHSGLVRGSALHPRFVDTFDHVFVGLSRLDCAVHVSRRSIDCRIEQVIS